MNDRELNYQDLLDIVKLIEASPDINDFHLKFGDTELRLSKTGALPMESGAATPALPPSPTVSATSEPAVAVSAAAPDAATYPPNAAMVRSPMVGTFYRAPEPGATPFVSVGQRVTADSTVCIIEVMKLMNSIPARRAGVVTHILVDDSSPVEFNQVLVVIDPEG